MTTPAHPHLARTRSSQRNRRFLPRSSVPIARQTAQPGCRLTYCLRTSAAARGDSAAGRLRRKTASISIARGGLCARVISANAPRQSGSRRPPRPHYTGRLPQMVSGQRGPAPAAATSTSDVARRLTFMWRRINCSRRVSLYRR